jgi:hypothetical protein
VIDQPADKNNPHGRGRSHARDHCRQLVCQLRTCSNQYPMGGQIPLFRGSYNNRRKRGQIELLLIYCSDDGVAG